MCVEGSWGAGESRDEYDQDTLCICTKISNNIRKKNPQILHRIFII